MCLYGQCISELWTHSTLNSHFVQICKLTSVIIPAFRPTPLPPMCGR